MEHLYLLKRRQPDQAGVLRLNEGVDAPAG